MKRDHYTTLGVGESADAEEIKSAFRRKAKESHPDTGGSHESFTALQLAYSTLSDPDRRKRYDETGDDSEPKQGVAFQMVVSVMLGLAERDVDDLLGKAREYFRFEKKEHAEAAEGWEKRAVKVAMSAARVKARSGENLVAQAMANQAAQFRAAKAGCLGKIATADEALAILDGYECAPKTTEFTYGNFTATQMEQMGEKYGYSKFW